VPKSWIFVATAVGCIVVFKGFWLMLYLLNSAKFYYFDAQDVVKFEDTSQKLLPLSAETGTFEPLLKHYLDVAKLVVTLAAASITFGETKAPPTGILVAKLILAFSILYGVAFCVFTLYRYDEYTQSRTALTRTWYCTVEALGFSALTLFILGYIAWAVALISNA
jgi:hypothetical protein